MGVASKLAERYEGEGIPVLIIHGWEMRGSVEASDFEPIFETEKGYRRIYVDLPGMGDSPADGVDDLDSIFDRLKDFILNNIKERFLVIGSSCGGYLARAVAYEFRSQVDGLLLRFPVVEPYSPKRDMDPFKPLIADQNVMQALSQQDRENFGDIPIQTPQYIDILRKKLENECLPAIVASDSKVLDPIQKDPARYRLTKPMHTRSVPFENPTLIVTGRQDSVVGYRDAWALSDSYPRATYIAMDRATHALPVDEQHLFEALVRDWLRRVEESRRYFVV